MEMRSQVKAESQAEMDGAESEDTDKEDRDDEDFEALITKDPENNGILEWREQMAPTVVFEQETGPYHKGDPTIAGGATPAPLCRTSDLMRCTRAMTRACCPTSCHYPSHALCALSAERTLCFQVTSEKRHAARTPSR